MKNLVIEKKSFLELVKKRDFRLPDFQREYGWDGENWEEFIQSITNFIDIKKEIMTVEDDDKWNLDQQEYFAGDIILQKGNENNDFSEIIDGQQRLVTIFVLLYVIYENMENTAEEKKDIENILFLKKVKRGKEEKKVRIDLNNENDKQEFKKALGFSQTNEPIKKKGRKKKDGNILNARKFFTNFFETETNYKVHEIYDIIIENFYFALVEIHHNDKVEELFTALNNTGLNLSNSDLLKALLIRKIKEISPKEIIRIWEKKIVEIVTDASRRQTINREMDRFLIDFWWAKYWEKKNENETEEKIIKPTKLSIYNLFKVKIKESSEVAREILISLAKYAEVYKYIKDPEYSWWEETSWPIEVFYIVNDISILNYSQLFPIILKIYFELEVISDEEKKNVIQELRTILLFIFRWITVKGKSPGDIPRFIPSILEEIATRKKLFNNDLKREWLNREFGKSGREEFYNDFQIYTTKKNKIWEFVLRRYYWRKYQTEFELEQKENSTLDFKQQAIYNWRKASVEHLIPQTLSEEHKLNSEEFKEDTTYCLGNVTLVEGNSNSGFSNKVWKEKKEKIKKLGNFCPLNWEKSSLFDLEELTSEDIKNRSKSLIKEFKSEKMKLFDIPWIDKEGEWETKNNKNENETNW